MEEATAVCPWTTACSPARMIFPGALAVTSIFPVLSFLFKFVKFELVWLMIITGVLSKSTLFSFKKKKILICNLEVKWSWFQRFGSEIDEEQTKRALEGHGRWKGNAYRRRLSRYSKGRRKFGGGMRPSWGICSSRANQTSLNSCSG